MISLTSSSLWATLGLLLALGFRHGLDPDHLAAVDALTRMRFHAQNYWTSRLTGFQFALGHSLTVLLATLFLYWQGLGLPIWLDDLGVWISSGFLLVLGLMNLHHCLSPGWTRTKGQPEGPGSWAHRGHGYLHFHGNGTHTPHLNALSPVGSVRWIQPLIMKIMGPLAHPMGVGFAFALSLDTLGQAALMAAKGHELGGVALIVVLALSFGTGMLLADSLNGWVVHWMMRQSEQLAHHTARFMSGLIAALSLCTVFFSLGKSHSQALAQWWEHWGTGCALTLPVLFFAGMWARQAFKTHSTKALHSSAGLL
jgi:nickel/cobalt transporter (NiCoT) family protein